MNFAADTWFDGSLSKLCASPAGQEFSKLARSPLTAEADLALAYRENVYRPSESEPVAKSEPVKSDALVKLNCWRGSTPKTLRSNSSKRSILWPRHPKASRSWPKTQPSAWQRPAAQKRDRKWEVALASRNFASIAAALWPEPPRASRSAVIKRETRAAFSAVALPAPQSISRARNSGECARQCSRHVG